MSDATLANLEERQRRLERRLQVFQAAFVVSLVVIAAGALSNSSTHAQPKEPAATILRARGLIIEDEQGRERILLGAPIPKVAGRKRDDPATALIFLGENGADRVVVGFSPQPQAKGKVIPRISPSGGIQINDKDGNERGGFSYLDNGRVVLGLDHPNGTEAITASVDDREGYAAVLMNARKGPPERISIYVGEDGTALMKVADTTGWERLILSVKDQSPGQFLLGDPKEKTFKDVLEKLKQ